MKVKKSLIAFVVAGIMVLSIGIAWSMNSGIKIQNKEGIGKYLTDSEGMTLYWFKMDAPGSSACTGPCIKNWPVYYGESIEAPEGTKKDEFGTITRADGKKQTTFRGYPLYYWVNDTKPGDTNGEGLNGVWFVVKPDSFPPK
jgi:predicted lipoprotein with Yx(FWY)xxD motif